MWHVIQELGDALFGASKAVFNYTAVAMDMSKDLRSPIFGGEAVVAVSYGLCQSLETIDFIMTVRFVLQDLAIITMQWCG
jgi:hypothetical protein